MRTQCEEVRNQLGEFLDGELAGPVREKVDAHLAGCGSCQRELARLDRVARVLATAAQSAAPPALWAAIESRLDETAAAAPPPLGRSGMRAPAYRILARPLAAAAVLLLVVGLGWLATNTPWESQALAAQIDFRPLLEQAHGDIGAGVQALMRAYGGETLSAGQAARRVQVRVQAPDELPGGLELRGRYLLNMGRSHQSLAWHFVGPRDQHLLLLQCPPEIEKKYGGHECMACSMGAHSGEGLQVGRLRLMHKASANVCICIVTTLDESRLAGVLDAVSIQF